MKSLGLLYDHLIWPKQVNVFFVFFLISSKYIREDARESKQLKEN
jgi:hypothetical protein